MSHIIYYNVTTGPYSRALEEDEEISDSLWQGG